MEAPPLASLSLTHVYYNPNDVFSTICAFLAQLWLNSRSPPYVPAAVMVVVISFAADRTKMRGVYILGLLPISMIGYILLIASRDNHVRYAADAM